MMSNNGQTLPLCQSNQNNQANPADSKTQTSKISFEIENY